jgi:hypothetical protein
MLLDAPPSLKMEGLIAAAWSCRRAKLYSFSMPGVRSGSTPSPEMVQTNGVGKKASRIRFHMVR